MALFPHTLCLSSTKGDWLANLKEGSSLRAARDRICIPCKTTLLIYPFLLVCIAVVMPRSCFWVDALRARPSSSIRLASFSKDVDNVSGY